MDGSTTTRFMLCGKRPSFGPKGKDKFSGFRGLDFGFLGFRLVFVGGVSKDVKTKLAPKLAEGLSKRKLIFQPQCFRCYVKEGNKNNPTH